MDVYSGNDLRLPLPDNAEILRYLRADGAHREPLALIEECVKESTPLLAPAVCACELDVEVLDGRVRMGAVTVKSRDLARYFDGASGVLLFCATLGIGFERLLQKHTRFSPAKAVCLDALGSERIEALCDVFCHAMKEKYGERGVLLKPRFSPGYGDAPLSLQREIFEILQCHRHVGVSLTDGLLMSPSKSVTAFVALKKKTE